MYSQHKEMYTTHTHAYNMQYQGISEILHYSPPPLPLFFLYLFFSLSLLNGLMDET